MTDKEIIQQLIKNRPSGRADKYSLNLHRWLKEHASNEKAGCSFEASSWQPAPYKDGFIIGKLVGAFMYGSLISAIISRGNRASYSNYSNYEYPIPDFWQNYYKDGKCYLDPDHKLYPPNERWEMIDDDHRRCRWCGRMEKRERYEEIVQRQRWILEVKDDTNRP